MKNNPRDPYREWSYQDRCDAGWDSKQRDNCREYDEDAASSDRAYDEYRAGHGFHDPDPNGRFH